MRSVSSLLLLMSGIFLASVTLAKAADVSLGTLNVLVENDQGTPVQNARLYVRGVSGRRLTDTKECPGHVQVALPPADYQVYAAAIEEGHDFADHFASSETKISITPAGTVSLVLHLSAREDPLSRLTSDDMTRMGLDPALLKDVN